MIETDIVNLVIPTSSHIPEIGNRLYIADNPTSSVTYPMAIMFPISRVEDMFESRVKTERFQFSCFADTLSSATIVAEAIKDKIKGYFGSTVSTSYMFINCWFDNMTYIYDDSVYKHVRILDMMIRYREQ
jgi:hypothetical protein